MILCPNCITNITQKRRQDKMSECLMDITSASINTTCIKWEPSIHYVNFHELFEKFIITSPAHLLSDSFYRQQTQHISFQTTTSTPMFQQKERQSVKKTIIGSQFPIGFDYNLLKCNMLYSPKNADFGYVKFDDSEDFLFLSKINHNVSDIINFGKYESTHIRKGVFSTRGGGAGGIVFADTDSPNLSESTSKGSPVLMERPKSMSCSVNYINNDSKPVGYNTICNKLRIYRIRSRDRFKNVCNNEFERNILVREMIERLKSILVFLFLKNKNDDEDGLLSDLRAILHSPSEYMKTFYQMGLSFFQSLMLAWGIEGEETRNHQQLKAHVDGNKKNKIETLSLFPRIAESKVIPDNDFDNKEYSGFIYFPLHGFSVYVGCGSDVINCSLKSTVHMPDDSRNYKNFSKVNKY